MIQFDRQSSPFTCFNPDPFELENERYVLRGDVLQLNLNPIPGLLAACTMMKL